MYRSVKCTSVVAFAYENYVIRYGLKDDIAPPRNDLFAIMNEIEFNIFFLLIYP